MHHSSSVYLFNGLVTVHHKIYKGKGVSRQDVFFYYMCLATNIAISTFWMINLHIKIFIELDSFIVNEFGETVILSIEL